MTSSNFIDKRHVPEEELHAYLDQALSRAQCVEIESHLAVCSGCRQLRDEIAALRDRTTALLSTLTPRHIDVPSLGVIRERAQRRTQRRERILRHTAWAASVLLALGFGWSARELMTNGSSPVEFERPAARAGTETPSPAIEQVSLADDPGQAAQETGEPARAGTGDTTDRPDPTRGEAAAVPVATLAQQQADDPVGIDLTGQPLVSDSARMAEPRIQLTTTNLSSADEFASEGLWRSMSWDGALEERGDEWIPRIDGLPVVDVQMQPAGEDDQQPLVVISQRLASGEVIRTFEGPVTAVNELLSRQSGQSVTASLDLLVENDSLETQPRDAARDVPRMLAIQGSISVDSLRTLLLRLR